MSSKLSVLFLVGFIIVNSCGCVSIPGPNTGIQKEQKLSWNVSYLRGLVIVQGALKTEPIEFEKAVISKDAARLKGNYADGRIVQIVISKISNSESSVVVNMGASPADREEVKKILEAIVRHSKR